MREFVAALEYVRRKRGLALPRWTLERAVEQYGADYAKTRWIARVLNRLPTALLVDFCGTPEDFVERAVHLVWGITEEEARSRFEVLRSVAKALGVERDWYDDWETVRARCGWVRVLTFGEWADLYGLKPPEQQSNEGESS